MTTRLVALVIAFFVSQQLTQAQNFFTLQWEITEPTESFREAAGTGFGFRATYMHFVNSRLAITGTAGYMKWGPRVDSPPKNEYKVVAIPIQLGVKVLLSRGIVAPYVGFSLGADYLRTRGIASGGTTYADANELKFGFTPCIGVGVHIVGPVGLNLTGAYNVIYASDSPAKYFGLNAGLSIGL